MQAPNIPIQRVRTQCLWSARITTKLGGNVRLKRCKLRAGKGAQCGIALNLQRPQNERRRAVGASWNAILLRMRVGAWPNIADRALARRHFVAESTVGRSIVRLVFEVSGKFWQPG
jgi:hypothetical protein